MALMDSYLNLITSQHRDKPKYMSMLGALLRSGEDIFRLAVYMDEAFDLDNAVGAQQDALGEIVRQGRSLDFKVADEFLPRLDDTTYGNILRAKIIKNLWDGGIEDLYAKWLVLFGAPIRVVDNQDMTIDVNLDVDDSDENGKNELTRKLVYKGYVVPKPMGVRINYKFHFPEIILARPIGHRAALRQKVDAAHCFWNLGEVRTARRDGEFRRDRSVRRNRISPDTRYRERQAHRAALWMAVDARQTGRMANLRDGAHCRCGGRRRDGAHRGNLLQHACTITAVTNGEEGRAMTL